MRFENTKVITFSPTGGTYKIAKALAQGIGLPYEMIDMTTPKSRAKAQTEFDRDLVIIATPVYSGHVPDFAMGLFKKLKGHNTPAIITCVYGNRDFEETLKEMQDLIEIQGFIAIAASAHIAEHSFSDDNNSIAAGRPHAQDLGEAKQFGRKIWDMFKENDFLAQRGLVVPFKPKPVKGFPDMVEPFIPKTFPATNQFWTECILLCPTGAMTIRDEELITDKEKCLFCMACVKGWPQVRYTDHPFLSVARDNLKQLPDKGNELWL